MPLLNAIDDTLIDRLAAESATRLGHVKRVEHSASAQQDVMPGILAQQGLNTLATPMRMEPLFAA
jgi:hypothetical protein